MLVRCLLRATTAARQSQSEWQLSICRSFAAKPPMPNPKAVKKPKSKFDSKPDELQVTDPLFSVKQEAELRRRLLAEDDKNPSLDVGPNGRPLFTSAPSLSLLIKDDINSYFKFSMEELREVLPEGLPIGMVKEFEDSSRSALLVRQSFIDLRDNFRRAADPSILVNSKAPKVRKQIVLDGPVSCGKSIALAMLVHWARKEGWLVFYSPKGRDWTHGGFFYKNPHTGLWDTPVQATNILRDFLKYNKSCLQGLKCNIHDPIPLGEGIGVGWPKGNDKMQISEGMTLFQLIEAALNYKDGSSKKTEDGSSKENNGYAAVGALIRLRSELSKVTSVPVLFAIDQYNSWFTFSNFEEVVTVRSCRDIHAREIATVNAFRSMMNEDMMVGAFSHSTAVGKLRQDLPDVPIDARLNLPRYNLDEAATVCHYYLRQRLVTRDAFTEDNWKKIFFLSNGNGTEMRHLVPFMR